MTDSDIHPMEKQKIRTFRNGRTVVNERRYEQFN